MSDPDHPEEKTPYGRTYRRASEKYQQYAERWRRAVQTIGHHCRTQRQKYGGWEQEKKVLEVAAVVLILIYTVIQGCQLSVIRDQEKRQLRAYVFVNEANIVDFGSTTKPPIAHVGVKNSGQTPAYKMRGWIGLKGEKFPFSGQFEVHEHPTPTVIAPGGTFSYDLPWKRPLTEEENTLIRNGTLALYVWGEIVYEDAFEIFCFTKFRYYFGGDIGIAESGRMAVAKEGNEANCQ